MGLTLAIAQLNLWQFPFSFLAHLLFRSRAYFVFPIPIYKSPIALSFGPGALAVDHIPMEYQCLSTGTSHMFWKK